MLRRIIKGIRREKGDAPRDTRLPLTPLVLQKLFAFIGNPRVNITARMVRAAFATATLGLLRCCEFASGSRCTPGLPLRYADIQFMPGLVNCQKIIIVLRSAKTDPFHVGQKVVIGRSYVSLYLSLYNVSLMASFHCQRSSLWTIRVLHSHVQWLLTKLRDLLSWPD